MTSSPFSLWRECLTEFAGVATLLIATCAYASLLSHPDSPVVHAIPNANARRVLMGLLMAATVLLLTHTPWAKRSGGHFNPAVTLTFWHLKKVWASDAVFYIVFQFLGAIVGMAIGNAFLGHWLKAPQVGFVATHPNPGVDGRLIAFAAECAMTTLLMSVVLWSGNYFKLHRFTPWLVAATVAGCIIFGAPLSGTGLNPARSFAPEIYAQIWDSLWIYITAPTLGMLLAAQCYLALGPGRVVCAKLHHHNDQPCPFRCEYASWIAAHRTEDSVTADKAAASEHSS